MQSSIQFHWEFKSWKNNELILSWGDNKHEHGFWQSSIVEVRALSLQLSFHLPLLDMTLILCRILWMKCRKYIDQLKVHV